MIRVIVVDDERPARERLKKILSNSSDLAVIAEAGDGTSALDLIESEKPDVVFFRYRNAIVNTSFLIELKREGDRKFTAMLSDKKQSQISISRDRLPEVKKFLGLNYLNRSGDLLHLLKAHKYYSNVI